MLSASAIGMEHCEVGMFKMPGIMFEKGQIPPELHEEMAAWAKENKCGYPMNEWLWSFKSSEKRNWFVLRWIDSIPRPEEEE